MTSTSRSALLNRFGNLLAAYCLLIFGCGERVERPISSPPTPTNELPRAPVAEPQEPTRVEAPSSETLAQFAAARSEGRRLSRAGDHAAALESFERALRLLNTPRTECEAGYVAFRSGALPRAEALVTSALRRLPIGRAVRSELREPTAMCLYNAGLVLEALGQPGRAVQAYQRSLELRSNATVSRRLTGARAAAEGPSAVAEVDHSRVQGAFNPDLQAAEEPLRPLIEELVVMGPAGEVSNRLHRLSLAMPALVLEINDEGAVSLTLLLVDGQRALQYDLGAAGGPDSTVSFEGETTPNVGSIVAAFSVSESFNECEYTGENLYECARGATTYRVYCRLTGARPDRSLECARVPIEETRDVGLYDNNHDHERCESRREVQVSASGLTVSAPGESDVPECLADAMESQTHFTWDEVFDQFDS